MRIRKRFLTSGLGREYGQLTVGSRWQVESAHISGPLLTEVNIKRRYPSAEVIGLDLSPIQPSWYALVLNPQCKPKDLILSPSGSHRTCSFKSMMPKATGLGLGILLIWSILGTWVAQSKIGQGYLRKHFGMF